jgi:hypothetical protein
MHVTRPVLLALVLAQTTLAQPAPSLWGQHGERWTPASQLPDFSYAGYQSGNAPLPDLPVATNVKDHGAKGDGKTDDTAALLAAIKATPSGVVLIPEGRYVLTDVLKLDRSNLVLRGAGVGKTVLVIPKSLQQLRPANDVDVDKAAYSFSGGFVALSGADKGTKVADIVTPIRASTARTPIAGTQRVPGSPDPTDLVARRGARTLTLSSVNGIHPGDHVRLQTNNDPTLGRHLHGDEFDAGPGTLEYKNFISWVARVTAVDGPTVTLDRPLRIDLRAAWKPELYAWRPTVENVGVEGLTFEFAGVPKKPHLKEEGFNAVFFNGAANAWARDIEVVDCDVAFNVTNARFCTVQNITCRANQRTNPTGHHALWARRAQDCLFDTFNIDTEYVHDLSVEGFACGNVFMNGRGVALNFDHHRNAPYENLFTDIDAGDPKRLWQSSGRGDRGPNSAARETFWNIRHTGTKVPKLPDWPQMIVVGIEGYAPSQATPRHIIESASIQPRNLYQAQVQLRSARP